MTQGVCLKTFKYVPTVTPTDNVNYSQVRDFLELLIQTFFKQLNNISIQYSININVINTNIKINLNIKLNFKYTKY